MVKAWPIKIGTPCIYAMGMENKFFINIYLTGSDFLSFSFLQILYVTYIYKYLDAFPEIELSTRSTASKVQICYTKNLRLLIGHS